MLCTTSVSPLDRDKDTVLDPRKMRAHFSAIKNLESTSDVRSTKQEPLRFMQRRQKFREREECEGRRTAFQSGLLLSHFLLMKSFLLRTTSVSPLDRDKDTVLDPRKMRAHFSVQRFFPQHLLRNYAAAAASSGYSFPSSSSRTSFTVSIPTVFPFESRTIRSFESNFKTFSISSS